MSLALAEAIAAQNPKLLPVFSTAFQSVRQWTTYIEAHFGRTPSVAGILDKPAGLDTADFHALYIACWLHFPVEKGSYMIRLTDEQRVNVKVGYKKLGLRVSSHFSGHGRSASSGWNFLAGYGELLVQMEGGGKHSPGESKYVFLKCEGHTVTHPAHLLGWVHKIKHGVGLMASPELNALAQDSAFGIRERAAENFNNDYKEFLKYLGIYDTAKKLTTVQQATKATWEHMIRALGRVPTCRTKLIGYLSANGIDTGINARDVPALSNRQLALLITNVLVPIVNDINAKNFDNGEMYPSDDVLAFTQAFKSAAPSLTSIAERLQSDAELLGEDHEERNFEEIRLAPATIDRSLKEFYDRLKA